MKTIRLAAALASVAALGSLATAQITSIGQFVGNAGTEGFESQSSSTSGSGGCIIGRAFNNQADLCSGAQLVTSGWSFGCQIPPHSGGRFTGSASGVSVYTFDQCVSRFGGFMGNNTPSATDGVVTFFDDTGIAVGSSPFTAPNNCTWTWNGWDFGALRIKSIEVALNSFGGFTMMDDMEVDTASCSGGSTGTGTPMCFGDGTGTVCPCGNQGGTGQGCANSVTTGAALAGSGAASVSADSLVLDATNGRPNTFGIFFGGTNSLNGGNGNIFGDGLLCVTGSIRRLEVTNSSGSGDTSSSVMIHSLDNSLAGDTRYYQYWYRDPNGSPCGSTFNTSGALRIDWVQ